MKKIAKNESQNRIFLYIGAQVDTLKEKVIMLVKKLEKESNPVDLEVLDAQGLTIEAIKSSLFTPSLFGSDKIIWVKNYKLNEKKINTNTNQLLELLHSPFPDQNILVLTAESLDKNTSSYSILSKISKIEYDESEDVGIRNECMARLSDLHMTISPAAVNLLSSLFEKDVQRFRSEFEKLITYVGNKKSRIEEKDVYDITYQSQTEPSFKIVDEIITKNTSRAIELFKDLLKQNENIIGFITQILNAVRFLIQAKSLIGECLSTVKRIPASYHRDWLKNLSETLPQGIKDILPDEQNILKLHPYRAYIIFKRTEQYSISQLLKMYKNVILVYESAISMKLKERAIESFILQTTTS